MIYNEDTFNDIYSSYSNKIYNFIYKILGDKNIAEDITQETFIQVFQKYETFRGESNILTWIYTIAKNNCFKYFNKTRRVTFQDIENLINTTSIPIEKTEYDNLVKQIYIDQVKEGCLLGLLRCLSYYQRISFILHILYEIPIMVTALIINKSPNAARILIHRARSNLKTFLCKNCSLYDAKNNCKCENLISFSLKQGWIKRENDSLISKKIEFELHTFGDEIAIYKTLKDHQSPEEIAIRIKNIINLKKNQIFNKKK